MILQIVITIFYTVILYTVITNETDSCVAEKSIQTGNPTTSFVQLLHNL